MSTVPWANYLSDGTVRSDESDKYALYKFLDKLDDLAATSGMLAISTFCDSTDAQVNLGREELPEGMHSTNDLMAKKGVWVDANSAVQLFETLLSVIQSKNIRFGMLRNHHVEVVSELEESLSFARQAAQTGAKFNFAIVQ